MIKYCGNVIKNQSFPMNTFTQQIGIEIRVVGELLGFASKTLRKRRT